MKDGARTVRNRRSLDVSEERLLVICQYLAFSS